MPNVVDTKQYEIVQQLLQRQDEALEQLEQLNLRVEAAIKEVNAYRGVETESSEPLKEIGEIAGDDSLMGPISASKAA